MSVGEDRIVDGLRLGLAHVVEEERDGRPIGGQGGLGGRVAQRGKPQIGAKTTHGQIQIKGVAGRAAQIISRTLTDIHASHAWIGADHVEIQRVAAANEYRDRHQQLIEDIHRFKADNGCERLTSVWCGSTEVHTELADVHLDPDRFEAGLKSSHDLISPSMIYAYAHIMAGVPYANGAPNVAVDTPALVQLSKVKGVPHPRVQWYKDGHRLTNSEHYKIGT